VYWATRRIDVGSATGLDSLLGVHLVKLTVTYGEWRFTSTDSLLLMWMDLNDLLNAPTGLLLGKDSQVFIAYEGG
jgi:hypothetical protein